MVKAKTISKRFMSFLLLFFIILNSFAISVRPVEAYSMAAINSLIDGKDGGYVINSFSENIHNGNSSESNIWNISSIFLNGKSLSELTSKTTWQNVYGYTADAAYEAFKNVNVVNGTVTNAITSSTCSAVSAGSNVSLLGWPYKKISSGIFGLVGDGATSNEIQIASDIAQKLGTSLNQLMAIASNSYSTAGYDDVVDATIAASLYITPGISPAAQDSLYGFAVIKGIGAGGAYTVYYGTNANKKEGVNLTQGTITSNLQNLPHVDENGNALMYIVKTETDKNGNDIEKEYTPQELEKLGIIWAMPKNETTKTDDAKYITIHQLAAYGNFNYGVKGIYLQNYTQELGLVEDAIFSLITSITNGIMEAFKLYSMDELIFNTGARGTAEFNNGLMSTGWWNIVIKYFTIFQALAWIFLTLALAKQLATINMKGFSNSRDRSNFMELLVKFFAVGACLVLCIPITRFMLDINNALVQVFAAAYAGDMSTVPRTGNVFATIFMDIMMFVITFYTNFIYIMRGITLAILIAMGPFFIVMMAFSSKTDMFTKWLQEVSSNIFLQAFHAFIFSFLFEAVVAGGGFIEKFVVIFSIQPLTELFQKLVLNGGAATALGKQAAQMGMGLIKGTMSGHGEAVSRNVARRIDKVGAATGVYDGAGNGGGGGAGGGGGPGGGGGSGGGGGGSGGGAIMNALRAKAAQRDENGNMSTSSKAANVLAAVGGGIGNVGQALGGAFDMAEGVVSGDMMQAKRGAEAAGRAAGRAAPSLGNYVAQSAGALSKDKSAGGIQNLVTANGKNVQICHGAQKVVAPNGVSSLKYENSGDGADFCRNLNENKANCDAFIKNGGYVERDGQGNVSAAYIPRAGDTLISAIPLSLEGTNASSVREPQPSDSKIRRAFDSYSKNSSNNKGVYS